LYLSKTPIIATGSWGGFSPSLYMMLWTVPLAPFVSPEAVQRLAVSLNFVPLQRIMLFGSPPSLPSLFPSAFGLLTALIRAIGCWSSLTLLWLWSTMSFFRAHANVPCLRKAAFSTFGRVSRVRHCHLFQSATVNSPSPRRLSSERNSA
jgi:hypothetical protein